MEHTDCIYTVHWTQPSKAKGELSFDTMDGARDFLACLHSDTKPYIEYEE